ncbi:hypothetical protein E3J85_00350 [Patescibacteria group bacterium]|nr:MAG: hypothetical protein E3J85_00350 [Patescibacteria group bacterium]
MEWFWNIINRVLAIIGYEISYEPFASWANYEINWGTVLIILLMAVALLVLVAIKTWQLKRYYRSLIKVYETGWEELRGQVKGHLEDEKFEEALNVLEKRTKGNTASVDALWDIRGIRRRLGNSLITGSFGRGTYARVYAWNQVYGHCGGLLRWLLGAPRRPEPPESRENSDTPRE